MNDKEKRKMLVALEKIRKKYDKKLLHPRGEMDLVRLTQLIIKGKATVKVCGLLGGEFGYGTDYSNDVFEMHPFCWCDRKDCKMCTKDFPHFIHRKSGLEIHWYKWIGRDMRYSKNIPDKEWNMILKECRDSVRKDSNGKN
jgi:hypothetical protein